MQLRLEPDVSNELGFARVQLPFHCNAKIAEFNAAPTTGNVSINEARSALVWEIGAHSSSLFPR